ncbi:MAG TPA: hypothetical protein VJ836_03535 [Candidatus Saccharimonadales bacterium]|nr:hypothetical protein [Candidatus Saccharimonadales bacterium]
MENMKSRWSELKPAVVALRRSGKSLSFIEANLEIPRSTLSGWCKDIQLTNTQRNKLAKDRLAALSTARLAVAGKRRLKKQIRLKEAEESALHTLSSLNLTADLQKVALAMLCHGEGSKAQAISLRSSDPKVLAFFLAVLRKNYGVRTEAISCKIHLRQGQNSEQEVAYWRKSLALPPGSFQQVQFDKRTHGITEQAYHGVCVVRCSDIAIQQKLVYLYKSFTEKVVSDLGGD